MTLFKILWGFDCVLGLIALFFFMDGMGTASNSGAYIRAWMTILISIGAILGGSILLKNNDHLVIAKLILSIPAYPAIIYLVWIMMMLILQPKWQ